MSVTSVNNFLGPWLATSRRVRTRAFVPERMLIDHLRPPRFSRLARAPSETAQARNSIAGAAEKDRGALNSYFLLILTISW